MPEKNVPGGTVSTEEDNLVREYRTLQGILDRNRRSMSVRELARLAWLRWRLGVERPVLLPDQQRRAA
jgi:hypothetical protein